MSISDLNINEIIGFVIATVGGGIGSHWVKMRRDIKSAHCKIRDIRDQLEKLKREVRDVQENEETKSARD